MYTASAWLTRSRGDTIRWRLAAYIVCARAVRVDCPCEHPHTKIAGVHPAHKTRTPYPPHRRQVVAFELTVVETWVTGDSPGLGIRLVRFPARWTPRELKDIGLQVAALSYKPGDVRGRAALPKSRESRFIYRLSNRNASCRRSLYAGKQGVVVQFKRRDF
jgi:hypothetical protein